MNKGDPNHFFINIEGETFTKDTYLISGKTFIDVDSSRLLSVDS